MICYNCGTKLEEGTKKCPVCGYVFEAEINDRKDRKQRKMRASSEKPVRKKKKVSPIIVILLVILLSVFIVPGIINIYFTSDYYRYKEYQRYMSHAEDFMEDESYHTALTSLDMALYFNPGSLEAYKMKVDAYIGYEEPDEIYNVWIEASENLTQDECDELMEYIAERIIEEP